MEAAPVPAERSIFQASLEYPTEERPAFIEKQCCGDKRLERRLKRLLDADARGREAGSDIVHPKTEAEACGPYRLVKELGEGGMGVVYLVEQTHPVKRLVALKVVKHGMQSKEVIARLESERRALALMNHRHIARILDAGTSRSGRPYFVMEYVPGEPIVEFCTRRALSLDARLRLFADVCLAVQHAHHKGIIHRDLKPSNILVMEEDGQPVPKVIDFGIAKATGHRLVDRSLYTEVGKILGTPEYMSPEQADASISDVNTRSDIYSLGVILYELLAEALPFTFSNPDDLAEMLRVVREDEPILPSQKGPSRRRRTLKGELDWIAMKALAKKPADRYPTAQSFAEDILRFLNDEPIRAGHPGLAWLAGLAGKLRKLARRHRGALGAIALRNARARFYRACRSST